MGLDPYQGKMLSYIGCIDFTLNLHAYLTGIILTAGGVHYMNSTEPLGLSGSQSVSVTMLMALSYEQPGCKPHVVET